VEYKDAARRYEAGQTLDAIRAFEAIRVEHRCLDIDCPEHGAAQSETIDEWLVTAKR
jgi:hypothetical protein